MYRLVLCCVYIFVIVECTHIITVEKDFSNVKNDQALEKDVREILGRLKTFKIPVHPRIHLFYQLLHSKVRDYSHRTADTLYKPDTYNAKKIKLKENEVSQ